MTPPPPLRSIPLPSLSLTPMNAPASPVSPAAAVQRGSLVVSLAGVVLALSAGAVAFGVVSGVHPLFVIPKEFEAPSIGMAPEVYLNNRRAQERVDRRHAMVYVGLLGALLGVALGLASALRTQVWLAPLFAAPLAALGGALGGYFGSHVQEYVIEHIGQPELLHTVLAQGALLAPLALATLFGLWLATRRGQALGAAVSVGLAAGLIAAVAYPIVVSLVRPGASTDHLLPLDRGSQLLWFLMVSGILGCAALLAPRPDKGLRQ